MNCMINVKSLGLSEPQFPHLLDRDDAHSFPHKVVLRKK